MFDNFAPDAYKNNPRARTQWATETLKKAAKASNRLGLNAHATFSGALLWHTWHPWPQRPDGLVEMGFKNWPTGGCPFSTPLMKTVWTFAMKSTPVDPTMG